MTADATEAAVELAAEANIDLAGLRGTGADGKVVKRDVETAVSSLKAAAEERREAIDAQRKSHGRMVKAVQELEEAIDAVDDFPVPAGHEDQYGGVRNRLRYCLEALAGWAGNVESQIAVNERAHRAELARHGL